MKRSKIFFGFIVLASVASLSLASFWPNKLTGDFELGGKTLTDPPKNEAKNTHFYIHIEGAGALTLFKSMKTKAKYDQCLDDGSTTKRVGKMQCTQSKDGSTHDCYFGIDIEHQTIEDGVTC